MNPLLSAAMIVRDESAYLEDCLVSLQGIVDEIVVVDTGSVDDTVTIAERLGARVMRCPWQDDFSLARNASLEEARGDWILYIDADERLAPTSRDQIESLLRGADECAFRILLRPTVDSTPYREYRLWRNDPRIRFDGIIHEKVVPAIHRVADEDHRPIGLADLLLEHVGYEGDQTRKHHRNLPLLRRQLEVEPGNLFAWHHLSRVLTGLGLQDESEVALCQAIDVARTGHPVDPVAALSYVDLIWLRRRQGRDTSDLLLEAQTHFPDNCVVQWIEVQQFIAAGDYDQAITALDRILAIDWQDQQNEGPAYDLSLAGELPWDAKGLCHFKMGRYFEAAEAYERAACLAPRNQTYPVKAALARSRVTEIGSDRRQSLKPCSHTRTSPFRESEPAGVK